MEHDCVAGLRRDACRFEATRTATGDDDAPLRRGAPCRPPLCLAAGACVDGAVDDSLSTAAVLDDADAQPDLVRAPVPRLRHPFRVGELRAADPDEVRLSLHECPLRELRMPDPAGDDHGDVDLGLHCLRHVEREAFVEGRVLDVVPAHSRRDREVVHRGSVLKRDGDLPRVVERQAARDVVLRAEPRPDRKVVSAPRTDLLDDLDEQPQPSLQ